MSRLKTKRLNILILWMLTIIWNGTILEQIKYVFRQKNMMISNYISIKSREQLIIIQWNTCCSYHSSDIYEKCLDPNSSFIKSKGNLDMKIEIGYAGVLEEDAIKMCIGTDSYEGKSAIACVHFLLVNAARHNVAESIFNEEIQQLGLPKDHAAAVSRVLTANAASIRQKLVDKAFKINELTSVRYIPPTEDTKTINCATFEIKLSDEVVNDLPEECTTHIVNMSYENVKALLEELKTAQNLIQQNSIEEWSGVS